MMERAMVPHIVERKRRERLPEDSGEWMPVLRHFRRLPPPRDAKLKRTLRRLSAGHAFAQAAILGLCTYAAFELLHERDFPMLMVVATVVGLVTSVACGAWLARRYCLDTHDTINVVMRSQFWWFVLMLIPCYGWAAFIGLGMPCVFGSVFGTWLGAQTGIQKGANT
jgi:hypothetical protein